MTDERIDPKVIEVAAKAVHDVRYGSLWEWDEPNAEAERSFCRKMAEAAIRAADRERGLKEERRPYLYEERGAVRGAYLRPEHRLVSDWRPVERGGEDG